MRLRRTQELFIGKGCFMLRHSSKEQETYDNPST
jgi:hypothetical protein